MQRPYGIALSALIVLLAFSASRCVGQESDQGSVYGALPIHDAVSAADWQRIDRSVDRGLAFLASQQLADGSFPSSVGAQPAVTSLGVMAFLSRGHRPGVGPYGVAIDKAIDYVLACQEPSGLLALDKYRFSNTSAITWSRRPHTATYNHGISGLMLGEAYGQGDAELNKRLKPAILAALRWARQLQQRPPRYAEDAGGWRYIHPGEPGKPASDLSATGWFLMFYRSARNAEFDVPAEHAREAVDFVERCYDPASGGFFYGPNRRDQLLSRGMTGAGLLALTLGGRRDEAIARSAGEWIVQNPFDDYNATIGIHDRFHYGAYYCSQAMYLLGGDYWSQFYPVLAGTLIANQEGDGGWQYEAKYDDSRFGRCYTSSLAVLSLTPPYQLLPIYQR